MANVECSPGLKTGSYGDCNGGVRVFTLNCYLVPHFLTLNPVFWGCKRQVGSSVVEVSPCAASTQTERAEQIGRFLARVDIACLQVPALCCFVLFAGEPDGAALWHFRGRNAGDVTWTSCRSLFLSSTMC